MRVLNTVGGNRGRVVLFCVVGALDFFVPRRFGCKSAALAVFLRILGICSGSSSSVVGVWQDGIYGIIAKSDGSSPLPTNSGEACGHGVTLWSHS